MGFAMARTVELEHLSCGNCGIVFAVPEWWLSERRDRGAADRSFYCPNGHCRVFRETELDRVKRELEEAKRRAEWQSARADRAYREAAAARGQVTKLRRRIQNGVCPACQRSFTNLRRHMATKHPTLALPAPAAG
jgi:hypothetical protein